MLETARSKRNNKKKKNNSKGILFIILIIFSILLILIYYKNVLMAVSAEWPADVNIQIPSGSSSSKIASILKEEGLIKNELIFKIAVKKFKADGNLKAGTYTLSTGMNVDDIIHELSKGGKNENVVKFTIPEGYEIRQMADKLSEEGFVDKEKFLELTSDKKYFQDKFPILEELKDGQSLEGFLYPSTYEIYIDSSEEDIISKMLSQFIKVYEEEIKPNIGDMDLSFNEIVTLASIIEREGKLDEEMELISAVFHNRLNQNMALQSCATVQYVLGERKEVLSEKDTQIESDFNTYIHLGLPPAPIASPGKKSLIAAINPAEVDYLYFRTKEDGTGAHTFSRTYEEHLNANPNK
ncbi:endolytic transglycosylase MltG [Clostridium sp. Cult2]|uniref:endolytic transglycosylase MltG n=1 Tax=Clostridium sp. Cult2 TaxID=2079003 RepID=UPI001F019A7F